MQHMNTFACFLFFLERKYQQLSSVLIFQLIADKIVQFAKNSLKDEIRSDANGHNDDIALRDEDFKKSTQTQIQLVTLYVLLNEYSEFNFKKVVKMNESLKVAIGKLEWFKEVHFFSWF